MFENENEMSIMFEEFLKINFGNSYLKECKGLFGIPDFVFYSKQNQNISIISFELKLRNWKQAAKQAFRYKSFSNMAYVVLSRTNMNAAAKNIFLFEKYNIGLATFNNQSNFEILYKPRIDLPYSALLNQKIKDTLPNRQNKVKNLDIIY
jgi:hypothetical protein